MAGAIFSYATLFDGNQEEPIKNEPISAEVRGANVGWFSVTVKYDLKQIKPFNGPKICYFEPLREYLIRIKNIVAYTDEKTQNKVSLIPENEDSSLNSSNTIFLTPNPRYRMEIPSGDNLTIKYDAAILSSSDIAGINAFKDFILERKCNLKSAIADKLKSRQFSVDDKIIISDYEQIFQIKPLIHETYKPNNKKVLFVIQSTKKYGSNLLLKNIIKTSKEKYNIDPIILVLKDNENPTEYNQYGCLYDLDITAYDCNVRQGQFLEFLNQAKKIGCNTAICNSLTTGIVANSLKQNGFTVTYLLHELPELYKIFDLRKSIIDIFECSDNVIFPCEQAIGRYEEEDLLVNNNKWVVPQGIYLQNNITTFSEKETKKQEIRQKLDISSKKNVVLGCGTGYLIKGIDYFVDTAIDVIKEIPDTVFVWIGHFSSSEDNTGRVLAERQIKIFGLEDNIKLLDYVNNPDDYFCAADVYYLPSRTDTFPSTILEASINFVPSVIFKDGGGAEELVSEEKNGFIVDYGDKNKAKEAIVKILLSQQKRKRLAENAKKTAGEYRMDVYVQKVLKIAIDK